jgi:hypothetical protein
LIALSKKSFTLAALKATILSYFAMHHHHPLLTCPLPARSKLFSDAEMTRPPLHHESPHQKHARYTVSGQDCGHPSYTSNYVSFYFAIKARYPHMQLIANCPMGDAAPTDVFDWHMYTTSR